MGDNSEYSIVGDNIGNPLIGNGTNMSKFGPNGQYFAASAMTSTFIPNANYMQVIPNSHYWSNLDMLLTYLGYIQISGNQWYTAWSAEVEHLIIGLENTIKNGYKLKKVSGIVNLEPYYRSIEHIISDIKEADINSPDYNANEFLKYLIETIKGTINMGYNLTNGLKMERKDVYKRIDGERDYQDRTWVARRTLDGTPDEEKPVAEWINYIEFHIAKAKDRVYHLDTEGALAEIRKVTALGVRTMEIHGAPERITVVGTDKSMETKQ